MRTCAADELDLAIVLVRPEVGHGRKARRGALAAEHLLGDVNALLHGVRPMLDSRGIPVPDIGHPSHVAGGIHIGRGLAGAVADDSVVERQTAALEPFRVGHDADAHHDDVGVHARTVGQCDARNTRLAIDVGDGHARSNVHAMVGVHRHEHLAERRSDNRSQRNGAGIRWR